MLAALNRFFLILTLCTTASAQTAGVSTEELKLKIKEQQEQFKNSEEARIQEEVNQSIAKKVKFVTEGLSVFEATAKKQGLPYVVSWAYERVTKHTDAKGKVTEFASDTSWITAYGELSNKIVCSIESQNRRAVNQVDDGKGHQQEDRYNDTYRILMIQCPDADYYLFETVEPENIFDRLNPAPNNGTSSYSIKVYKGSDINSAENYF